MIYRKSVPKFTPEQARGGSGTNSQDLPLKLKDKAERRLLEAA
jgi:hypothetical protein